MFNIKSGVGYKQIFLNVVELKDGKIGEKNDFDTALFCQMSLRGASEADSHSGAHRITNNKVDTDKILMQGLVQPSNPGVIHVPS